MSYRCDTVVILFLKKTSEKLIKIRMPAEIIVNHTQVER